MLVNGYTEQHTFSANVILTILDYYNSSLTSITTCQFKDANFKGQLEKILIHAIEVHLKNLNSFLVDWPTWPTLPTIQECKRCSILTTTFSRTVVENSIRLTAILKETVNEAPLLHPSRIYTNEYWKCSHIKLLQRRKIETKLCDIMVNFWLWYCPYGSMEELGPLLLAADLEGIWYSKHLVWQVWMPL